MRPNAKTVTAALLMLLLPLALSAGCRQLAAPIHFSTAIEWQGYEAGLARAKAEHKPILLLFSANWCEPCHDFAKVFEDPRIVARAKDFVVIDVNVDEREDLARKYRRGGSGIPRVYFLTPDGMVLNGAHSPWRCAKYAYDRKDPASLLAGMELALKLARDPDVAPNEDPAAPTPAQACTPAAADGECNACVKAHCCAEMVTCLNDPGGCMCPPMTRATTVSLFACTKEYCPQCPHP